MCLCVCVHVCTHACVALTNQNREALTNHNGLWVCAGAGSWKSFAVPSQIVWLWNDGKVEYILRKGLLAQVINDLQHCPGRKMKDGVCVSMNVCVFTCVEVSACVLLGICVSVYVCVCVCV